MTIQDWLVVVAVLLALGSVVMYAIRAWRALQRGECGHCASCGGQSRQDVTDVPVTRKERLVFLPASHLRRRR